MAGDYADVVAAAGEAGATRFALTGLGRSIAANRVSHAFPAPASLPGAYFVAVPVAKAPHAVALLREAIEDGALPGGEIPDAKR